MDSALGVFIRDGLLEVLELIEYLLYYPAYLMFLWTKLCCKIAYFVFDWPIHFLIAFFIIVIVVSLFLFILERFNFMTSPTSFLRITYRKWFGSTRRGETRLAPGVVTTVKED